MDLDRIRVEVELMRVKTARAEQLLKIAERQAEIKRLEEHVKVQDDKIRELETKLKNV